MLDTLNKEITKVREKIRTRDKLKQRINKLKIELRDEEKRLEDLKIKLVKEQKDVELLEGKTLSSLIQTLIGNKQEKLEIEKEEYIVAKIKYDECKNKVNTLIIQINHINYKLEELENIALHRIIDKISNTNLDIKEISEAYSAGNKLLTTVYDTINFLQKAQSWGTFDMLGGGMISTLIKHDYLDEAKRNSYKIKTYISSFKMELEDINLNLNINGNLDSFLTFADYFFDGLFVDWYVQSNINNALNNAKELEQNVINILQKLENQKKIANEKLYKLKEEYIQVIDKY